MHPCGILVVFLTLATAASGLKCYQCIGATDPKSCTGTTQCSVLFNRCYSLTLEVGGYTVVNKGCQNSFACGDSIECCEGDLCNSANVPIGSSLLLLLVSSTITMLFL